MSPEQFKALSPGMLVRHKNSGNALIVHGNYGDHVIAARITRLSSPDEWDVVTPGGAVVRPNIRSELLAAERALNRSKRAMDASTFGGRSRTEEAEREVRRLREHLNAHEADAALATDAGGE